MYITKEEKIKGIIRKTDKELDKIFLDDIKEKYRVLLIFFDLIKDVIEEKI
jgi:hypothetical protein